MSSAHRGFRYFHYDPSAAAAIAFTAIFAVSTAMHLFQTVRTRSWFSIPFVIGGCLSIVGYISRYIASRQTPDWTLGPFAAQTLGLLLAPALYAATIYMALKRILTSIKAEHLSPVKPRFLTGLFVSGDVLSFIIQTIGGILLTREDIDLINKGRTIVLIGLFVQLVFFGLFLVTSIAVQIRVQGSPTAYSQSSQIPWKKHLFCLYFMSGLILIRSIFRVIEYLQGQGGYLLSHEIFLYIFDAVLMTFVTYAMNLIHPSEIAALTHGGIVSRAGGFKYERVDAVDAKSTSGAELSPLSMRDNDAAV